MPQLRALGSGLVRYGARSSWSHSRFYRRYLEGAKLLLLVALAVNMNVAQAFKAIAALVAAIGGRDSCPLALAARFNGALGS